MTVNHLERANQLLVESRRKRIEVALHSIVRQAHHEQRQIVIYLISDNCIALLAQTALQLRLNLSQLLCGQPYLDNACFHTLALGSISGLISCVTPAYLPALYVAILLQMILLPTSICTLFTCFL